MLLVGQVSPLETNKGSGLALWDLDILDTKNYLLVITEAAGQIFATFRHGSRWSLLQSASAAPKYNF